MLRNSGTLVKATLYAALCCAVLAACSGKTPATPTTGSSPATVARLRVLGTRVGQPTAFGITVFLVNVLRSFSYLFAGLALATTIMRVPLFRTVAGV